MSAHQIKAELLKFSERRTLKALIRGKVGRVTVREARELMNPTGRKMWIQAVFGAVLCAGLGLIFSVWLVLVAPVVLVGLPIRNIRERGRWLTLLPPSRDDDLLEVVW